MRHEVSLTRYHMRIHMNKAKGGPRSRNQCHTGVRLLFYFFGAAARFESSGPYDNIRYSLVLKTHGEFDAFVIEENGIFLL